MPTMAHSQAINLNRASTAQYEINIAQEKFLWQHNMHQYYHGLLVGSLAAYMNGPPPINPLPDNKPTAISLIVLSWNRARQLALTLGRIAALQYPGLQTIVVDNDSGDGSPEMVRREFPRVRLLCMPRNLGCHARNHGAALAEGRYLVMLDDDSWPLPGSLQKMVRIFERNPSLGALGFRSRLPDGREESIGAHCVFQGCGVGFRREAFFRAGGYPYGYGFYVEEYDLSFRLLAAGYDVAWGHDLWVEHRRSAANRNLNSIIYRLVRNNLWLWPALLPWNLARPQLIQTLVRHGRVARKENAMPAYLRGLAAGLVRLPLALSARPKLSPAASQSILGHDLIPQGLHQAADALSLPRLALLVYSRETVLFIKWAEKLEIELVGLYDDFLCRYRSRAWGLPVYPLEKLASCPAQTAVVASTSPGAASRARRAAQRMNPRLEVRDLIPWQYDG